jgi:hypothetical protein
MKTTFGRCASVILLGGTLAAAQHSSTLKHRGDAAMGFDQDKTVHHFLLRQTGGAIEVTSKDPADAESIKQIRSHFREIADSFGRGLFDKPVATHGELPPGADKLAINRERIKYRYEERATGAAVMIETQDPGTLKALHDFLRYQIIEHKTGDPLTAQR